ncbi:hypothetical protein J2Y02_005574 [Neobacillus drentensis]|nr:hypothetical protein [Neobacillus drentensis]
MTRKWKWTIACFFFLLFLNAFGVIAVMILGR